MRWITVIVGLVLCMVAAVGCKQQCFLSECDYQHYRELGIPPNLDHDPWAMTEVASVPPGGEPATILHPERKIRYISLAEAIALALENGTVNAGGVGRSLNSNLGTFAGQFNAAADSIRVLALDPAIQGLDIESALSKFDARWISSMQWSFQDVPTGNPAVNIQAIGASQTLQGISTFTGNFSSSFLKPLPTGGVAGITFTTRYTDTNSPIQRLNPSYNPTLQFQFEQPLLQGFGVDINQLRTAHPGSVLTPFQTATRAQEGILLTRIRFDQSRAEFERQMQLLVWDVEQAYWNLYGAYWNLYSQEQALRQALVAWQIADIRLTEGKATEADRAQARGQYELFRGNYLTAMGQGEGSGGRNGGGVLEAERILRGHLGLPMEDGCRLVPCDQPTLAPYQPDYCTSWLEAMTLRPELVLAREEIKHNQLEVLLAKNDLLPDLRFTSTYELQSIGSRLDGPGPSNALRELASNHFDSWSLGLQLNVPIGFRDAHASLRLARLRLARSYLVLRDQEYRAEWYLVQQYREVLEKWQLIQARRAQREAFGVQVRVRFEEYRVGKQQPGERAPIDVLLEAERFWADALSTEYQAIVDYNIALSSWEFAKGTLLQHDNIVIGEGPLPHCAQVRAVEHLQEKTKALNLHERAALGPCCGQPVGGLPVVEPVGHQAPALPGVIENSLDPQKGPLEQLPQPRPTPGQPSIEFIPGPTPVPGSGQPQGETHATPAPAAPMTPLGAEPHPTTLPSLPEPSTPRRP